MNAILPIHIAAGVTGIVSGTVALCSLKGEHLHRRSGMTFVYSMVLLTVTGAVIAVTKQQRVNLLQAILTFYLVTTALLTVRRPARNVRAIDLGSICAGLILFTAYAFSGAAAAGSATGNIDGYPPPFFVIFGAVTLLAVVGDIRMLGAGSLQGVRRLSRHLWRMCFSMFIATGSFFLGQAKFFPEPIRIYPLLALPVLASLLAMIYWLWRVRTGRLEKKPRRLSPRELGAA